MIWLIYRLFNVEFVDWNIFAKVVIIILGEVIFHC